MTMRTFKKFKMKKKANIIDIIFIGVFIFVFSIMLILLSLFLTEMNDGMQDADVFDDDALEIISTQEALFAPLWDKAIAFALVGLSIFTWISAFFIRSHPAFFMFGFFILVIYIFVFAILSDAYVELTVQEDLATHAEKFPIMVFLLTNFPIVMTILGVITAIITYSKGGEPNF